jgi:hypothetical protein
LDSKTEANEGEEQEEEEENLDDAHKTVSRYIQNSEWKALVV